MSLVLSFFLYNMELWTLHTLWSTHCSLQTFLPSFPPRQSTLLSPAHKALISFQLFSVLPSLFSCLSSLFLVLVRSGGSQVGYGIYSLWRIMERFLKPELIRYISRNCKVCTTLIRTVGAKISWAARSQGLPKCAGAWHKKELGWEGRCEASLFLRISVPLFVFLVSGATVPISSTPREVKGFLICAPSQDSSCSPTVDNVG